MCGISFFFFSCRVLDERWRGENTWGQRKKAIRVCPPSLLLFRFFFLLTHKTFRILFFLSHLFPIRCRSCCLPLLIQEYLEEEEKYMFKFPRIAISFREDSNVTQN
jgi:hypothetical protein